MIAVLMGVAGSGKTTLGRMLAARMGWLFHDADLDHQTQSIDKMRRGIALSDEDRAAWIALLRSRVVGWLGEGRDVVLACSALRSEHRRELLVDPQRMRLIHLVAPVQVLRERLHGRTHFFPEGLLDSQLEALEQPDDAVVVDTVGEPGAVVDRLVLLLGG